MVAVAVASLAVHAIIIVVLQVRVGPGPIDVAHTDAAKKKAAELVAPPEAEPSCTTKALLGATARAFYCATPMAGSDCAAELPDDYLSKRNECSLVVLDKDLPPLPESAPPVRIALLDDAALAKLKPLDVAPLLDPKIEKKVKEKQKEQLAQKVEQARRRVEARSGQVVEITRPKLEMVPDHARYVSEYDSAVKRETVARGSTEKMVERPGRKDLPITPQPLDSPEVARSRPPSSDTINPLGTGALSMRRPGAPQEVPRDEAPGPRRGSIDPIAANGLAPHRGSGDRLRHMTTQKPAGQNGDGGQVGRPKMPDLKPSKEFLSRLAGGGSVDRLDGVADGENTALNTKRWKYASFFNRMKRQVAQNWHPAEVWMQRDPYGNVYGDKDRTTVVRVALRMDGSLAGIYIEHGSGVDFLDEEAVRAFRVAQPFPNPPAGLRDPESDIITFSFGFRFEIGAPSTSWRIFRYE